MRFRILVAHCLYLLFGSTAETIAQTPMSTAIAKEKKKRINPSEAWRDARELIYAHRHRLALGMLLMIVNRLVGLVLPASSKFLIDDVIIKHRSELLVPLALAAGGATLIQALSSFALTQVLGVAAQRAITDMRKSVQEHVARLPIRYFDSTQTGILISRIMTDAEGIRNLVGTGLVQLVGGLVTAAIALGVLFYLNWRLTSITLLALAAFASCMALAFKRLRPLFRERGKINAEVTGRLTESLGGIRIVKAYAAEKREELVFARGAHRLFRNVARSMTAVAGVTAFSTIIVGTIGVILILVGGRAILSGPNDARRLLHVHDFHRAGGRTAGRDRFHRDADHGSLRRPRPHTRDQAYGH